MRKPKNSIHDPYHSMFEVKKRKSHFMADVDVHKKDPPANSLPSPKIQRFMTDEEWYKSELYRRLLPKKGKK